jgi:hypothetical protein
MPQVVADPPDRSRRAQRHQWQACLKDIKVVWLHRLQGVDTEENLMSPKVIESLLGTRLRGRDFTTSPLVGGSRNTLAIDADGQVGLQSCAIPSVISMMTMLRCRPSCI